MATTMTTATTAPTIMPILLDDSTDPTTLSLEAALCVGVAVVVGGVGFSPLVVVSIFVFVVVGVVVIVTVVSGTGVVDFVVGVVVAGLAVDGCIVQDDFQYLIVSMYNVYSSLALL